MGEEPAFGLVEDITEKNKTGVLRCFVTDRLECLLELGSPFLEVDRTTPLPLPVFQPRPPCSVHR